MSSHAQDQKTQTAASTEAQNASATQAANAAAAQKTANNEISTMFGTYNPDTNQYTGGTESANLSPSSMDTKGLTGSYASLYKTQADQQAKAAQDGVSTSLQNAASRGMGATPAGYTADQERQAYQQQAGNNSANYSNDFGNQHNEQVSLYQNANNMLANSANQNQNSATANNSGAAGTSTSLYSTSSQQQANPWATAAGSLAGLGSAASGFMPKTPCYIAAEIFGGWTEPRTMLVREWLLATAPRTKIGRTLLALYRKFGERIAAKIRVSNPLRVIFTQVCDEALGHATAWKAAA